MGSMQRLRRVLDIDVRHWRSTRLRVRRVDGGTHEPGVVILVDVDIVGRVLAETGMTMVFRSLTTEVDPSCEHGWLARIRHRSDVPSLVL